MTSKRKTKSHIVDTKAIEIIKRKLPVHWTVRDYRPDYGIDLVVELFEKPDYDSQDKDVYDTLGEHLFVQVKGTSKTERKKYKVYKRDNVEKRYLQGKHLQTEIDVFKFQIEVSELFTVSRMGTAIPVLLFYVDVSTEKIYYLCLNDYIDKVIVPSDRNYLRKKSKILNIPATNLIDENIESLIPIRHFAKRAKHYSFFNKASYQNGELMYVSENDLILQCKHFSEILLSLDIWGKYNVWPVLDVMHKALENLIHDKPLGLMKSNKCIVDNDNGLWETNFSNGMEYKMSDTLKFMEIRALWQQLSTLGKVYEDLCREWYLPTMLGTMTN